MRESVLSVLVALALPLAGCAIHPLPEDVTRETTYHIVQKLRCEAREALAKLAIRALRESPNPRTRELADRLEASFAQGLATGKEDLTVVQLFEDPRLARYVDPDVHQNFNIFALSAFAFDFTFTITEENHNTAHANFRLPLTNGLFTLGLNAGKELDRVAERKLKTGHTFLDLYASTSPDVCMNIAAGGGNFIYPITGKIGLAEVFNTFYLLNRPYNPSLTNPYDEAYRKRRAAQDIENFSDTLTFTTRFIATVEPKIELDPISARRFRLADASHISAAKREDVHKVTITVEMGDPVTSLAHARGLAGLMAAARVAKQRALERADEIRRQQFFETQEQILKRLRIPPL